MIGLLVLQYVAVEAVKEVSWFTILKDIILLLVAIIGVGSAIFGLKTWRKQLKGNTEYQLARRLMIVIYKARDYVKIVRNPFMDGGEITQAFKENNEEVPNIHDKKYNIKVDRAVYSMRWRQLNSALSDLKIELLEAEVIWGKEVVTKLNAFYICIKDLNFAIYKHINVKDGIFKLTAEELKKNELIVYDTSDDPSENEFSGKFKQSVEEIECYIKPMLKL